MKKLRTFDFETSNFWGTFFFFFFPFFGCAANTTCYTPDMAATNLIELNDGTYKAKKPKNKALLKTL